MNIADKFETTERIANVIGQALAEIQRHHGIDDAVLLAAAHAQIVSMMAVILGGEEAALACERAAVSVRDTPPLSDALLAAAPSAGQA